jgi:hypothetical protein
MRAILFCRRPDVAKTVRQLPNLEALRGPVPSVPLRGYIVEEDANRVWIQDREGTWAVNRSDIVATQEWKGNDPRFQGKPTCVFIRDGADIFEIKPYKVKMSSLPITLESQGKEPAHEGERMMRKLEQKYVRHLGFLNEVDPGPLVLIGTTVCCYGDPSGFGLICEGDDCGPIVP